ncbi:hypothetical protein GCM10010973_36840 [Cribrihabitans marinus]|nr:hypothetical protein GCM10010973_36840 [Cribrihabitans marinus]
MQPPGHMPKSPLTGGAEALRATRRRDGGIREKKRAGALNKIGASVCFRSWMWLFDILDI